MGNEQLQLKSEFTCNRTPPINDVFRSGTAVSSFKRCVCMAAFALAKAARFGSVDVEVVGPVGA